MKRVKQSDVINQIHSVYVTGLLYKRIFFKRPRDFIKFIRTENRMGLKFDAINLVNE